MRKMLAAFMVVIMMTFAFTSPSTAADEPVAPEPIFTFVSAPDMTNADVGDVSIKRAGKGWEPGDPNSWNQDYSDAIDKVFSTIASHNPDAVFVAGDVVEGHWGQDTSNTGIFGPVGNFDQKELATRAAGNLYYSEWKSYFSKHGMSFNNVYPAVGDHEVGDNPWNPGTFKYERFDAFKEVWARNMTASGTRFPERPVGTNAEDTSYAKYVAPGVLLVTVDVFRKGGGEVTADVRDGHLTWFKKVINAASESDTVIVQGHTPAIGPVRISGSSALFLNGGPNNPFWQFMNNSNKVDFYFAGEVHAQTARRNGDTVQVTHGGLFAYGGTNYIVGNVYADGTVDLKSYNFQTTYSTERRLWATSDKRPPAVLKYGEADNTGSLVLSSDNVVSSGDLTLNPDLSNVPSSSKASPRRTYRK